MSAAQIFDLSGKHALVVGAGKIPAAIADLYEQSGAAVTRVATSEVATEASAEGIFATVPHIDILVNGAVRLGAYPLDELSLTTWDDIHGVNLRGAFLLMRGAARRMRAQGGGGRMINISTMGATHPVLDGNFAYGSSRAGLSALVRSFALDGAPDRILVNAILVGAVMSDPWPDGAPPPTGPGVRAERFPLGWGAPADVAPMALLLASGGGGYITGQTLTIDGGFAIA